jgi:hypothetical protein
VDGRGEARARDDVERVGAEVTRTERRVETQCCQARPMRSLGLSSHLLVDVDGGVTSAMALAELPLLSPLAAM